MKSGLSVAAAAALVAACAAPISNSPSISAAAMTGRIFPIPILPPIQTFGHSLSGTFARANDIGGRPVAARGQASCGATWD